MVKIMQKKWWHEAIVYELYPKSFNDSNGDGIGDIRGVIEKLDYLQELGIDTIWICPFYDSPMDDNGYDIKDFFNVWPGFGSMDDLNELIKKTHERGMRLVADLVLNHTSDEHPWFIESRSSLENSKRDYYIWRDGKNGGAPTNWEGFFGGPTWVEDKLTNQWYMKLFTDKMPDLNWESENMKKDLYSMIMWWINLGIDGFRVDAVAHLGKNRDFEDGELIGENKYSRAYHNYSTRPELDGYIKELCNKCFKDKGIMTVGEAGSGATAKDAFLYSDGSDEKFSMLFTFDHCWMDCNDGDPRVPGKWNATMNLDVKRFKDVCKTWYESMYGVGWNTLYWSNHDQPRVVSHYGDVENYWRESATALATALYLLWGTPYIYNGEEIGMTNIKMELNEYNDPEVFIFHQQSIQAGLEGEDVMQRIWNVARDNARTPMQWNANKNAGFTTGTPWLKVNENYRKINVESQLQDKNSIFNYYKKILAFRKNEYKDLIVYGKVEFLLMEDQNVMSYLRYDDSCDAVLVIVNLSSNNVDCSLNYDVMEVIQSNYCDSSNKISSLNLRPYEAIIFKVKNSK